MEWVIKNGCFQPVPIRYKNSVWREVWRLLPPIHDLCMELEATLYLRGSALESPEPHPMSDIDFVLIANREHWITVHRLLRATMSIDHRPIDVYFMQPADLESDILMRLLLHTRSERLAGPRLELKPVKADFHTAKAHWDKFAVWTLPDALISNQEANVCMVKQLLRSVGPIELMTRGRFSRELPTCLDWIKQYAPKNIRPYFQQAWYHIGSRQNPPLAIKPARDWLVEEWSQILSKNGE